MNKTIVYGDDAREKLLSGVKLIAKAVKVTLGPSGRNVLIRNADGEHKPFASKDGVTVAGQISSDDYVEQVAIEAVQDAANNADNKAGDGTTTATLLVEAIFQLGTEAIQKDVNLIDLNKGIELAVTHIVEQLKNLSVPCEKDYDKLLEVALISSNNDEIISKVVVDSFKVAGDQGVVNIKRSRTSETFLSTIKGMNVSTGFISRYFVNDFTYDAVDHEKCYVYFTNEKITSITTNFDLLLQAVSQAQEPLLIICKDIEPSVLTMLVENSTAGQLKVCVCKAPGFGEQQNEELEDIGVVLGKRPFMENDGLNFNTITLKEDESILDYIPRSEGIRATMNQLSIKGPIGVSPEDLERIEEQKKARVDYLRDKLEQQKTSYEKAQLQSRISRLAEGIAYINIGAVSDIEFDERQHRIQDSLYAVKSASEEGIIPGGGTTLMYISDMTYSVDGNHSMQIGYDIVMKAIQTPFFQILENVGMEVEDNTVIHIKENFNKGINARTQMPCEDMIKEGIVDPTKVTRVALENAASIAGMLLTTDCVVIDNAVYERRINKNEF